MSTLLRSCLLLASGLAAQDAPRLTADQLAPFRFRGVGPAVMGGRIVDIEVSPVHRDTLYVVAATGGLWKTQNHGTTWTSLFDHQSSFALGDLAITPSNPDILWLGTGEPNNQRSSYAGDGVYKSTDAGKTWKNMGLRDSRHIGRIVVDPRDADTVYVAALGHLYSFNDERGLYVTRDGGKTWRQALGLGDEVGFVDVTLDPDRPDTVFACSYERLRRAWHLTETGEGSRIWRSRDQGRTWHQLGGGLPGGKLGRIGIDVFRGDGRIVYATIEKDGGEVWRSEDGGDSWMKANQRPVGGLPGYYYGQIRIDPTDQDRVFVLGVPLYMSQDAGKTFSTISRGTHSDHHALWVDPVEPRRLLLGNDGGLYFSYDRGDSWWLVNNLPLAQFYTVHVDMRDPYWVWGGAQDNGTWGGPVENSSQRGIGNKDWQQVNGGDGFFVAADPLEPDVVYSESQFGALSRIDMRTGERRNIKPAAARGEPAYRFNWSSPILLSPHNPRIIYFGGNHLFRSLDRGDNWEKLGADLTTADPEKIKGNVPHCTLTAIAESPRRPGMLWVGTDDGNVQLSRNGGVTWDNLRGRFAGCPEGLWVSRIEPSTHDEKTAFVSFTGYREDDPAPYLFRTDDGGATFRAITGGLPRSSINVVRQDHVNKDLLFVGNEHGVQVSVDGGAQWLPLPGGMPTIAVHDLVVHPREPEIAVGTHGRGAYVMNIATLRQLTPKARGAAAWLFTPAPFKLRRRAGTMGDGFGGAAHWFAPNPAQEVAIDYWLAADQEAKVQLTLTDLEGKELRTLEGPGTKGLHRVTWDLRRGAPASSPASNPASGPAGQGGGGQRGGRGGRGDRAQQVEAGRYRVRLVAEAAGMEARIEIQSRD